MDVTEIWADVGAVVLMDVAEILEGMVLYYKNAIFYKYDKKKHYFINTQYLPVCVKL